MRAVIAALIGCALLASGFHRLVAARTPATTTWCGDPALATLDHVRLGNCEPGTTSYTVGHDVWIGLHRPTAALPSVVVRFSGFDAAEVDSVLLSELTAGTLDVARTDRSTRDVPELRARGELAQAVFVGDYRPDGGAELDARTLVTLVLGAILASAPFFQLAVWILRRMRGR